ncbi:unnamed protein product, partial [Symbiodinium pilosum]
VLRRLTGKCLMAHVREAAREHLFPTQLGVAVPGGAEVAVHTVRAWVGPLPCLGPLGCLDLWAAHHSSVWRCSYPVSNGSPAGRSARPSAFCGPWPPRFSGLDLGLFYLDDGVLAGDVPAVAAALTQTQRQAATLGLRLNLRKCEVVAVGDVSLGDLVAHFPGELLRELDGSSKVLRNFELLGAPVGDLASTKPHALTRVAGAKALLEALGELDDPQVGLRLLRACAGHCRLVHSMRCAPPEFQMEGFREFDQLVRSCFSSLTGLHLDTGQWEQAGLGFALGGLGLRSTVLDVDGHFSTAAVPTRPDVQQALAELNRHAAAPLTAPTALMLKQKPLTAGLDNNSWERRLAAGTTAAQAVLRSEAEPGARAFLAAVPNGRKRMEAGVFVAELRQRLGLPDAVLDAWCPRCDCVLDRFSYHAGLCSAGGERTLRHHALRDVLCSWAERAGLQPEREKPGLLLPSYL